jgi:hypothetical protein
MTEEEIKLRSKFYLAPKATSLEQLRVMNDKYTSYPGLTLEQAKESSNQLRDYKKTHTNK